MDDTRYFTLMSKAGRFVFPKKTILNHAKMIRDTVTASYLGVLLTCPPVNGFQPEKAVLWVRDNVGGPVGNAKINFEWIPT